MYKVKMLSESVLKMEDVCLSVYQYVSVCVQSHATPQSTLCRICEVDYMSPSKYVTHMTTAHCSVDIKATADMPYFCQLCQYRSSVYNDIIAHFRKVRCLSHPSCLVAYFRNIYYVSHRVIIILRR